jgi:hypothetical protein
MCCGTSGLFTDTFGVHLPWWRFRVVADEYEPGRWTELVAEYAGQARRAGRGKAKLVVPVTVHKRPAEADAATRRGVCAVLLLAFYEVAIMVEALWVATRAGCQQCGRRGMHLA